MEDISKSVHAIILAGGSADNPLARYRAMPAVELGEWLTILLPKIEVPLAKLSLCTTEGNHGHCNITVCACRLQHTAHRHLH